MSTLKNCLELKKQLDALRPLSADDEQRIMQKFRLDWNYHSNHLEGNSLTYGETKALILFNITAQGKPLKDHFEIKGHNEALLWVLDIIKEDRPLSENFIRELHKLILKESYEIDAITPEGKPTKKTVKVGEYKSTPNHVKTATGEIFRFATPEETPAKMNDLLAWYATEKNKEDVNPILLAAEFHYKYIRIHPFDDGNGRTARILMNFILLQYGYPPVIVKTEDKENYFAALRQADAGNIEAFINYIAINLRHSLELMIKGAQGESIEENDDIDKEIALLKQRVDIISLPLEVNKSPEQTNDTIIQSFVPLARMFMAKCELLSEFYLQNLFHIDIDGISDYLKEGVDIQEYIEKLAEKLKTKELLYANISCHYRTFNKQSFKEFNFISTVRISFKVGHYETTNRNDRSVLTKNYGTQLTNEEIKDIVNPEIKAHKDFIEQKLKEAEGNN